MEWQFHFSYSCEIDLSTAWACFPTWDLHAHSSVVQFVSLHAPPVPHALLLPLLNLKVRLLLGLEASRLLGGAGPTTNKLLFLSVVQVNCFTLCFQPVKVLRWWWCILAHLGLRLPALRGNSGPIATTRRGATTECSAKCRACCCSRQCERQHCNRRGCRSIITACHCHCPRGQLPNEHRRRGTGSHGR